MILYITICPANERTIENERVIGIFPQEHSERSYRAPASRTKLIYAIHVITNVAICRRDR